EHAELPQRILESQSLRLATAVRIRGLVRAGRSPAALAGPEVTGDTVDGGCIPVVCIPNRAHLVSARHEPVRPALAGGADLSDRQGQSRRPALCAFPRAGGADGAIRAARLAVTEIVVGLAAHRLRSACS